MGIYRAFAKQDTSIFEQSTTANVGLSPILQLQSIYNGITSRKEWSRILIKFNLSALTADIAAGNLPSPITDSTVSAYLYMFNAPHGDEQAQSFDINVHPITQEWDEGSGLDLDKLSETGFANAVSAQSTAAWTTSGGTYVVDSNSATQHFDHGEENIKILLNPIFNSWYQGTTGNFGLVLKLSDTIESKTNSTSAQSWYYKKFYGRETNTRKAPYIQLEWPNAIKDDRNQIEYNATGQLWFFNIVKGQLQDLNATAAFPGNVTLSGLSGVSWSAITTSITAARHSKGVYKCSTGVFPLTANAYSQFKDNWYVSASPTANYTFNFHTTNPSSGFDEYITSKYRIALKNLKSVYQKGEKSRIRIHIKDDSLTLIALTAGTTAASNFICTDGTWEIRELMTDDVEFSSSQLSYDKNGNFFEFDTNFLHMNTRYKIVLNLTIRGETIIINDNNFTFEIK